MCLSGTQNGHVNDWDKDMKLCPLLHGAFVYKNLQEGFAIETSWPLHVVYLPCEEASIMLCCVMVCSSMMCHDYVSSCYAIVFVIFPTLLHAGMRQL